MNQADNLFAYSW